MMMSAAIDACLLLLCAKYLLCEKTYCFISDHVLSMFVCTTHGCGFALQGESTRVNRGRPCGPCTHTTKRRSDWIVWWDMLDPVFLVILFHPLLDSLVEIWENQRRKNTVCCPHPKNKSTPPHHSKHGEASLPYSKHTRNAKKKRRETSTATHPLHPGAHENLLTVLQEEEVLVQNSKIIPLSNAARTPRNSDHENQKQSKTKTKTKTSLSLVLLSLFRA